MTQREIAESPVCLWIFRVVRVHECLGDRQREGRSNDLHELWGEALWGVGLIGSVVLLGVLIAAISAVELRTVRANIPTA